MNGTTRLGALKRALLLAAGAAGLGAGRAGAVTVPGVTSLVLHGRNLRSFSRERRSGELPLGGDRQTGHAELFHAPGGRPAGELHIAAFTLHGPGEPRAGDAERLELHTFVLENGTIVGSGALGRRGGEFAVLGGTGRYAGARGTYLVRGHGPALPGDGTAEFAFTLVL